MRFSQILNKRIKLWRAHIPAATFLENFAFYSHSFLLCAHRPRSRLRHGLASAHSAEGIDTNSFREEIFPGYSELYYVLRHLRHFPLPFPRTYSPVCARVWRYALMLFLWFTVGKRTFHEPWFSIPISSKKKILRPFVTASWIISFCRRLHIKILPRPYFLRGCIRKSIYVCFHVA